ncbi:hypothetical protein DSOL_3512 [Desulfosporosinus metallidurans]|uniref:Uncharacterized protein n=1 Tax=Desulfosporosinus metallidurans TaxID=1888891 RepID=A0A1Q8QQ63_9FIRM|nr:hypothetical protein DSOL_3512 [Desulfosporosinus metallidurans]
MNLCIFQSNELLRKLLFAVSLSPIILLAKQTFLASKAFEIS